VGVSSKGRKGQAKAGVEPRQVLQGTLARGSVQQEWETVEGHGPAGSGQGCQRQEAGAASGRE
jgi:hypothetical protein